MVCTTLDIVSRAFRLSQSERLLRHQFFVVAAPNRNCAAIAPRLERGCSATATQQQQRTARVHSAPDGWVISLHNMSPVLSAQSFSVIPVRLLH
jgi:hypothetical protein